MALNPLRLFQSANFGKPLGGRYQVLRQLGAGGFGQTFLATDLHLPGHPQCVIKQLKPQTTDPTSLQTARRLFNTEAEVLYQLGSHDQIPRLLAHFEENQEFYLAQELIEGVSLTHELSVGQPWPEPQVVALLHDLLTVLSFVHGQNVIHRDIKPSNLIRRGRDGRIVLIDFGAVKQVSTQLANPDTGPTKTISIGTQGYMPNEQVGGNPRFSSDIYAVGIIGIQALTGLHPRSLREDPYTSELLWRDRAPTVSPDLADIIDCMVRYDFRSRYPTAAEALTAVQALPAALQVAIIPGSAEPMAGPRPEAVDLPPTLPHRLAAVELGPMSGSSTRGSTQPTVAVGHRGRSPQFANPAEGMNAVPAGFRQPGASLAAAGLAVTAVIALGVIVNLRQEPAAQPPESAAVEGAPADPAATSPADTGSTSQASPVSALLQEADQLREAENYPDALRQYDAAIALNGDSAEAHWGRCYSLNQLQSYESAIVACDRAIELDPTNADALWSKGYALDQKQQHQEALTLYEQAIAQRPDFAQAWSNKGTALLLLERPAEAIAAFDRAIELDSTLAEAWNNRGAALWSQRRFPAAIESIEKALELRPDYVDAQRLLQEMRQRMNP